MKGSGLLGQTKGRHFACATIVLVIVAVSVMIYRSSKFLPLVPTGLDVTTLCRWILPEDARPDCPDCIDCADSDVIEPPQPSSLSPLDTLRSIARLNHSSFVDYLQSIDEMSSIDVPLEARTIDFFLQYREGDTDPKLGERIFNDTGVTSNPIVTSQDEPLESNLFA